MEDPIVKALEEGGLGVSRADPRGRYENLVEVGHGNFGVVYQASMGADIVAIKKIDVGSAKDKERLSEVRRELEILKRVRHPNCVDLSDIFVDGATVWIVMEFCVGSTKDLQNIVGTLTEPQIAYIAKYTLTALNYIHSLGYIHRDIKAENILFSQSGAIKLADFGSASLKSPANTFVGTPFWMAPEVILAMDDGQYTSKADIWSMGITAYEFGEKQPPLFHLNTMSALYHISQNDPPQLLGDKWSENYKDFTNSMLRKEENDRPTAEEMLGHAFLKCSGEDIQFSDLLQKCSVQAQKDNEKAVDSYLQYLSDSSTTGTGDGQEIGYDSELESDRPKSEFEKSKIDTLDEKMAAISISSSESAQTHKLLPDKNIGTIKTYDSITEETSRRKDIGHLQVKDYQALRRANQKKLLALDQKLTNEIATIKKNQQKSLELVKMINSKAVKGLVDRHEADIEKFKRNFKNELKNVLKNKIENAIERRNIINSLGNLESLLFNRSTFFTNISTNSTPTETLSRMESSPTYTEDITPNDSPKHSMKEGNYYECEKLVNDSISKLREIYKQMYNDKYKLLIAHRQNLGRIELSDSSVLVQKELYKLEKIFQKKQQLLKKLHEYETQTQNEYVKQKIIALKKSHMNDRKNRPSEFKNIEALFSKKYKTEVKNITEMYRSKLKNVSEKAPKETIAKLRNKLELEKINLILAKKKEMETQINLYQEENSKQDNFQSKELNDLESLLQQESQSLANYQASQLNHLAKTKMNELQCIHKRYEMLEEEIKRNTANEIKLLNDAQQVDLVELMKPFEFSFDNFVVKNKSLSQDIGNLTTSFLAKIENPYASLNLSKTRRKFLPEF